MARILLAAVAALLLCAPTANATIVVQRDVGSTTDEIWAYDDNGGNGRLLIPDNFATGQYDAFEPSTTATGGDVVFAASTPVYATYAGASSPPGACGRFCYGIYVLSGGAIRRLTPPVDPCDGFPCVIFEGSPEQAPGGNVVFDRYTKLWSACGSSWCTQDGQEVLARRPLTGGSEEATVIGTPDQCGNVESPAPHPTTAGLVLFEGCYGQLEGDYKNVYYASTVDASGAIAHLYYDDFPISDPAWSADGAYIVDAEGGTNPGLWLSTADGMGSQYVVAVGEDEYIRSPRFAGSKIVFVYKSDVYLIDPAQCEDPCAIADATKLTTTGDVASVTHTTASPQPYVKPTSGTGGTGDGDGGGGGGGVTPAPSPSPSPSPSPVPVVQPPALDAGYGLTGRRTLRGLLAGRLTLELTCDCAVTATLSLGRTVVARGAGTRTVKLKPTKAGKRKLRRLKRAKLKLIVRSGDRSFSRTVTLKR